MDEHSSENVTMLLRRTREGDHTAREQLFRIVQHELGGCSLKETAELLELSVGTIKADWRMAKAWLHRELTRE